MSLAHVVAICLQSHTKASNINQIQSSGHFFKVRRMWSSISEHELQITQGSFLIGSFGIVYSGKLPPSIGLSHNYFAWLVEESHWIVCLFGIWATKKNSQLQVNLFPARESMDFPHMAVEYHWLDYRRIWPWGPVPVDMLVYVCVPFWSLHIWFCYYTFDLLEKVVIVTRTCVC